MELAQYRAGDSIEALIDAVKMMKKKTLVVVNADWCRYSAKLKESLGKIDAETFGPDISVIVIETYDNPNIVSGLGLRAVPTTLLYDDKGKRLDCITGFLDINDFTKEVKERYSIKPKEERQG